MASEKGQKRLRNIPVLYDEKKSRHTMHLTDTAWQALQEMARQQGVSASEIVEQWVRSEIDKNSNSFPIGSRC
ncbi:hypothetical protein SD80_013545 [Scytonema tolypothrichoides VB-61278]|nr:hypothetical protein SD80_013545 [Scytonema tolypothrichoides VB-61278]